jgi:stearoyl-CoA desaturase (delta-9 desaturase)
MTNQPRPGATTAPPPRVNWLNVAFLFLSPLVALGAVGVYVQHQGVHVGDLLCFATMAVATGLAITAGYHRYYSHRTYECHPIVQVFYLAFGASALQAPVLDWVADHRDHHRFVDREGDPYNIKRGFFYAHMGWTFYKDAGQRDSARTHDLAKDGLVLAQRRHHEVLGLAVGFLCPFVIGLAFGRPWGGVLWGGLLRLVVAHHGTFLINSVGHRFGRQPYSGRDSSKDNALLALLTFGEGYHNFHHAHPRDFRNGVRWYDWDPTKWWIFTLSVLGLAWGLHRTPPARVRALQLRRPSPA